MGASLWDQSTTAASNTAVGGANVDEGCPPSGINNGIRASVAQALGAALGVTASGTDTYTATLAPAPDALTDGMTVHIRFTNSNATTTPTLNINSLGAKTIVKNGSAALVAGDIPAGHEGELRYNGTNFVLLNPKHGVTSVADATNGGVTVTNGTTAATLAIDVSDLSTATPTQSSTLAFEAGSGTKKAALAGSGTSLVGVAAATTAQVLAESSVETIVMPSRMKWHPGVAKVWGYVTNAGTPNLQVNYNVTSITDTGVGIVDVTIAVDFSSTRYSVVPGYNQDDNGHARAHDLAAGSFRIKTWTNDGVTVALADKDFSFAAFGAQ